MVRILSPALESTSLSLGFVLNLAMSSPVLNKKERGRSLENAITLGDVAQ
jgi:hypothetical protein